MGKEHAMRDEVTITTMHHTVISFFGKYTHVILQKTQTPASWQHCQTVTLT